MKAASCQDFDFIVKGYGSDEEEMTNLTLKLTSQVLICIHALQELLCFSGGFTTS